MGLSSPLHARQRNGDTLTPRPTCAASQVPPCSPPSAQVEQSKRGGRQGGGMASPGSAQHSTAAMPATKQSCLSRNSILYVQEQNCKGLPVANYK